MILVIEGSVKIVIKNRLILKAYLVIILIIYPLINKVYPFSYAQNFSRILLIIALSLLAITFKQKRKMKNEDILLILSGMQIVSSVLLFYTSGNIPVSALLREMLYSIMPIVIYFIFLDFPNYYKKISIEMVIKLIFFASVLGLLAYSYINVPIFGGFINDIRRSNPYKWQITSFYGPIVMGYLSQLAFALLIFEKYEGKFRRPLLVWFGFITMLILQRSAYIGILLAMGFYIYGLFRNQKLKQALKTIIRILGIGLAVVLLVIILDDLRILPWELKPLLVGKISHTRLEDVVFDRSNQFLVFNTNNIFNVLFGEGFGKYSPNNPYAMNKQPDAAYYRIFNELGLIGLILFFLPLLIKLFRSYKKNNFFMLYLIVHVLIAFYFNRIMWAIPSNFIIYMIVAIYQNDNDYQINNLHKKQT